MEIDVFEIIAIGSMFLSAVTLIAGFVIFAKSPQEKTITKKVIQEQEDCFEKIVALEKLVSTQGHDIHKLEFAIDKWINDYEEVLDVSYLMLQWIKATTVQLGEADLTPLPLHGDITIFENKYNGRFKSG